MTTQAGIYAIVNTVNGRAYVGSTTNFQKRWSQHRYRLRRGTHSNPRLRRAWAEYGASGFEFLVCEYVKDTGALPAREQHWLDLCRESAGVYNCDAVARSSRCNVSTGSGNPYPAFVNAATQEMIPAGVNLAALCRERGLGPSSMRNVARGVYRQHKGWTLLRERTAPAPMITGPTTAG